MTSKGHFNESCKDVSQEIQRVVYRHSRTPRECAASICSHCQVLLAGFGEFVWGVTVEPAPLSSSHVHCVPAYIRSVIACIRSVTRRYPGITKGTSIVCISRRRRLESLPVPIGRARFHPSILQRCRKFGTENVTGHTTERPMAEHRYSYAPVSQAWQSLSPELFHTRGHVLIHNSPAGSNPHSRDSPVSYESVK